MLCGCGRLAFVLIRRSARAAAPTRAERVDRRVSPESAGPRPCSDCDKPTIVGAAGEVDRAVAGQTASPLPDFGDVTLVQPLTGMNLVAHVTHHGRVPVVLFAADRRDGADAVLVLARPMRTSRS